MFIEKKVMVLMAHADDECLGAGGTIPKLVQNGCKVEIVIVSDGKLTARGTLQEQTSDCSRAARILGVPAPRFLNFKDQHFDAYPIADIANAVSNLNLEPDIIVSHLGTDLNKDHRIVAEVAKIIGRPKNKPIWILGSEIPNTSSWNGCQFPANFYVDISDTLEKKIEAFSQYSNELQDFPHPWSAEGLRVTAQFRGVEAGYRAAEAFHVVRGFLP